jgi:lipoprotein-anchoring transpeptidase ErfK/SrfK
MRRFASAALLAVSFVFLSFATAERAAADVFINVNKSTQRLTVTVDGAPRYTWAISSGLGGGPPSGSYRPERLERKWYSRKYDWAPMPHAIFFHHGFAIHGTNHLSRLGRPASHGCVRLHPSHAAALFDLVQRHGKSNTRIVISNSSMIAHR